MCDRLCLDPLPYRCDLLGLLQESPEIPPVRPADPAPITRVETEPVRPLFCVFLRPFLRPPFLRP